MFSHLNNPILRTLLSIFRPFPSLSQKGNLNPWKDDIIFQQFHYQMSYLLDVACVHLYSCVESAARSKIIQT